jgi:spermidine synthase
MGGFDASLGGEATAFRRGLFISRPSPTVPAMPGEKGAANVWTGACVVASGAAGLAYEILFSRSLGLFLGLDGFASLAVLCAFMTGMAIGYVVFGRAADRFSGRGLQLYALLEAAVAVYAVVFPGVLHFAKSTYLVFAGAGHPEGLPLIAVKGLIAVIVVLPAATLLGGTIPALARQAAGSGGAGETGLGRLYAANSFGAVLGCWFADFGLLPAFGLRNSTLAAAGLSLSAAMGAFLLSRRPGGSNRGALAPSASNGPAPADFEQPIRRRAAVLGAALSGAAGMVFEVAWMRMLALVLGSTTHAFSWMLSAFIAGITLGAAWIGMWPGGGNALRRFAVYQGALAALAAASMPFWGGLPFFFARASTWLAPDPAAYLPYSLLQGAVCFAAMVPPAFCLGAALPLAYQAAGADLHRVGGRVGGVFAANTIGGAAGALLAGLVLMPAFGLAGAVGAGIGLSVAAGGVAWAAAGGSFRPVRAAVAIGLAVACPWMGWAVFGDEWRRALTLGLWRDPRSVASYAEFRSLIRENRLVFHRDGAAATVSVNAFNDGVSEQLVLRVNGKPDASTSGDMATQLLLGHLPLLMHPQSSRVLVVGLGGGITSGAVLQHPSVARVDTVEIAPEVADAARLFAKWNHGALDDPRLKLMIEDARSVLQRPGDPYDVVVSEPSNPWIAGVAGLFTTEFYRHCRDRLAPNGLLVQWIHLYDNQQPALDLVLRTLSSVFPRVSLWRSQQRDLILIASTGAQGADLDATLARFEHPSVRADLERIGLARPAVLFSRELIGDGEGGWLVDAVGAVQTEDRPRLEYLAQPGFFAHQSALAWLGADQMLSPRADLLLTRFLKVRRLATDDYRAFVRGHLAFGLPESNLLRSIRVRWQADSSATGQLELISKLPPLGTVDELEALRLGSLRQEILSRAGSNRDLARHYLGLLKRIYRSQKSALWVPQGGELRAAAERLASLDSQGGAGELLILAEIAWDHGDDSGSLEFSRKALATIEWSGRAADEEFADAVARHIAALNAIGAADESATAARKAIDAGFSSPTVLAVARKALAGANRPLKAGSEP